MGDDIVTLYVKVHLHNILEIDDEGQQFMADVSVVRFKLALRPAHLAQLRSIARTDPQHNWTILLAVCRRRRGHRCVALTRP